MVRCYLYHGKTRFCELNPILKSDPNPNAKPMGADAYGAALRAAAVAAGPPVGFAFGFGSDFKIRFYSQNACFLVIQIASRH